jgi:lysophospholipase L1-like esterase
MNTTTKNAANSIVGKLTAGILAVATAFLAPSADAAVLVVGDSLEVGSAPHLRPALGGMPVDIDAQAGRTSGQGVRVLARRLGARHDVVVFPLGTNDTSADAFAGSLAAVRELAGERCIVVATIARPPLRGVSAAALNRVVARFAARGAAQVADWRSAAAATPGALGRDRTHATGQGYALRASLLAEAVQGCLLGGAAGGIPAPEDPDVRVPRRERPRPERPPAPPARLPARAALLRLGAALERLVRPVAAALRDAQMAATKGEPEPVLGAP